MHHPLRARAGIPAALLCASCAAASPRPSALSQHLPAYEGRATELFDDGISGEAAGRGVAPTASPRERDLLRQRTHMGDCVVRARVISITSTQDESGPSWLIGLHTVEKLAGARRLQDDFTVRIDGKASGAGIVRALDGQMIGAPLVAFLREFASTGESEAQLHFHLAGDGKDQVDAVRIAEIVGDIGP